MQEFLAMDGYAVFVWTSYGLTALVLVANALMPVIGGRVLRRQLRREMDQAAQSDVTGGEDAPGT